MTQFAMQQDDPRHLGDGAYASHDGYHIWVSADRDHIIESARLAWKSTQPKPTDPNARVAAIKEAAAAMQEILNDLERDHGVEVNDLTADIQRWAEGVSA